MTMNPSFRPILATPDCRTDEQLEVLLQTPKMLSPKLDGIRCILTNESNRPNTQPVFARSRKMLPIPNMHVQSKLAPVSMALSGFWADGELMIVKNEINDTSFNDVQSGIMSIGGEPNFEYHIFEIFDPSKPDEPFHKRHARAERFIAAFKDQFPFLKLVPHHTIHDINQLFAYETQYLASTPPNGPAPPANTSAQPDKPTHTSPVAGLTTSFAYEGVMLRDPNGPYKFGRSTLKQQFLTKWVRRDRCEAVVTGYEPLYHNANEDIKDEFGLAKRQTLTTGLIPMDLLGAVQTVPDLPSPVAVSVGTGFDAAQRKELWASKESLIGRILTIEYRGRFPDGSLRFPTFVGWRQD